MKLLKYILVIFLFLIFSSTFMGGNVDTIRVHNTEISPANKAFSPGESLKYQLYYGPVNAGEAKMKVSKTTYNNQTVHHLVTEAYSTGLASRIYRLHNTYESFINPSNGLPLKAIRDVNEGSHSRYNEVIYDHEKNVVHSKQSGTHEVPEYIMDKVSAIYKLRNYLNGRELSEGDVLFFETYLGDEIYPLIIHYKGTDEVRTRSGYYNALKFSPVAETGRMFKSEDAITIWLSNDKNLIPLKVRLNMLIGSVNADLIEYSGLQYKLTNSR